LRQGRPGSAALDVCEREPLDSDSPLLSLGNVLLSPHLGYVEQQNYEMLYPAAFQHVLDHAGSVVED
jgi:D-3-phosphoglycerate dehydrogenase